MEVLPRASWLDAGLVSGLYWCLADVSGGVGDAGLRGGTGHGLASLQGQLMTQSEHGALQLEPKDPMPIIVSVSQGELHHWLRC